MPDQHSASRGIVRAQRRADRERARAARAAGIAIRHELPAVRGSSPQPRAPHLDTAVMHHAIERRHNAVTRLNVAHAERLAADTAPTPRFTAALAEEVGVGHAGTSLVLGDWPAAVAIASDAVATAVQDPEDTLGEGSVHDVAAAEPLRVGRGGPGVPTLFDPPAESVVSQATDADALVCTALVAGAHHHVVQHQVSGTVAGQLGCDVADGVAMLRARVFATGRSLGTLADHVVHKD